MANQPYGYIPNPFIDSLELSVRASNVLRAWGRVNTLEDFMALDKETVMRLPRAGVRTWEEIKRYQDSLRADFAAMFQPEAPSPVMVRDMTLRDMAALSALQGFCAYSGSMGATFGPTELALRAFEIADAFIAAREGKSDKGLDDDL